MADQATTIPNGWKITTLGEVAKVLSGSTPSTKEDAYWDGDISWITPKDLSGYSSVYIQRGERNITNEGLKNSSAQILPKNTILFSSRAPIGYVVIAKNDVTTNQGFKNIICDEKESHFKYFYYWLKKNTGYIEGLSSGSTFSEASATVMKSLLVELPPLPEQIAIAAVLSSLDDKIELLREQNKTLEATAQAIFKEWFVNFNFPGATGKMIDSELDEIPEGWRVGKVKDEIETILGGTPSRSNESYWEKGTIPWINSGAINNFPVMEATEYITEAGLNKSAAKLMPAQTVVLPFVITPGSEIKISILGIESSGNQSVLGLLETDRFSCGYIYLWIQHMKNKLYSGATGGAQQHINKQEVENLELLIPTNNTLSNFNTVVSPMIEKIIENSFQIQTLSKLRDTLLPKLVRGELRVEGFEN